MIVLTLAILLLLILLVAILIISFARFYCWLNWNINKDSQQVEMTIRVIGFKIYQNSIHLLDDKEDTSSDSNLSKKNIKLLMHFFMNEVRTEKLQADIVIGAEEPDVTAIWYGIIQSIVEIIKSRQSNNATIDCQVAANFEENILEANGVCIFSWKLRKTIHVFKQWKKKGEK
ncbi:DUF2953 domain-containing protein [Gracilibacillus marinus]|uniref:DUF2953 domain-containing protein n=1 Tax=Gracilibacillus marinus TaxID=630535 RepID=A0ABV8VYD4_9BACI